MLDTKNIGKNRNSWLNAWEAQKVRLGRVFAESLVNNIFRDKWELGIRKREVAVEKVMNGVMFDLFYK